MMQSINIRLKEWYSAFNRITVNLNLIIEENKNHDHRSKLFLEPTLIHHEFLKMGYLPVH